MVTPTRIAYVGLLAIAILIPSVRWWHIAYTQWTPLTIPYPLHPATLPPTEFSIDSDAVYEIVLEITRPPLGTDARTKAECLMGWNPNWPFTDGPACPVPPVIDLNWRLVPLDGGASDDGALQGMAKEGGFSEAVDMRQLTTFSAKRGKRYRLETRTAADATPLAFVQPRIVVEPTMTTNEDQIAGTFADYIVAAVAGLAGFILLVVDVRTRLAGKPLGRG